LLRFTCPFDMTGSPTITLPCGFTAAGTPVAFQFVGRHLEEEMLVRAGYAYQAATDWHRKHPALPTDQANAAPPSPAASTTPTVDPPAHHSSSSPPRPHRR